MPDESVQSCSSTNTHLPDGDAAGQRDHLDQQQADSNATKLQYPYYGDGALRKVHPYNHTYLTYAKARWLGREILEVFSTEFRDRSNEFYAWAISTGTVMVNGQVVDGSYVIQNGDLISNVMHRHEPPILGGKVQVYHRDDANGVWVVEKKASMPIHSTGRYRKNTLLEVLKNEYGLEQVNTANRLDRLVSGIMIIALNREAAQRLSKCFAVPGTVKKEYVARVRGCFPEGDTICEEPLLTIDKQIGVNVVHPEGRPSKTIFTRLSFDPESDTSVVRCRPITGRSHQLRVHLQFLGHPIANDPIYSDTTAWGSSGGKGGLFNDRAAHHRDIPNGEQDQAVSKMVDALAATFIKPPVVDTLGDGVPFEDASGTNTPLEPATQPSSGRSTPLLADEAEKISATQTSRTSGRPKKTMEDYKALHPEFNTRKGTGSTVLTLEQDPLRGGSEVPLVPEAIQAITQLRKLRDEEEEFSRYRDMERPPMPRKIETYNQQYTQDSKTPVTEAAKANGGSTTNGDDVEAIAQITSRKGVKSMSNKEREILAEEKRTDEVMRLQEENPEYYIGMDEKGRYCNVCGTPLLPDPKVEQLSIWLHAIRYHTEDWDYSSPLPAWACEDWKVRQGSSP